MAQGDRGNFDRNRNARSVAEALAARQGDTNRVRNTVFDALVGKVGAQTAGTAAGVVDFVPGLGDMAGAEDAYQGFSRGDMLGGGLAAGATLLGLVPGVGDAAASGVKKGIKAFHGSPHDFDKFSLDKIGTGEGSQAYGHGLYFAESEGVARSYRDTLSANQPYRVKLDGQEVGARSGDNWMMDVQQEIARKTGGAPDGVPDFIYEGLIGRVSRARISGDDIDRAKLLKQFDHPSLTAEQREAVAVAADKAIAATQNVELMRPGRMYEVNINADPDEFYDFDALVMSEQSPSVVEKLRQEFGVIPQQLSYRQTPDGKFGIYEPNGKLFQVRGTEGEAAEYVAAHNARPNVSIADIVGQNKPEVAERLRKSGIPGVRYLDAMSRTAGEGSRNYVVFDDSLVEIIRKYGLAGLMAMGGMGALYGAQPQEEY